MDRKKVAVVSGARGQDASYISDLLISKGYTVVGIERRTSAPDYTNIAHLIDNTNFTLEQGDVTDFASMARIMQKYQPDEFYHLAAMSFVGASWNQPISTCEVDFIGTCNCLEALRLFSPKTKFFFASTSEVFGDVVTDTQDENSPIRPLSPYGAAKAGSELLLKTYVDSYGIFACFARSFNHEGTRRGKEFVTRKITNWIGESYNKVKRFPGDIYNMQQRFDACIIDNTIKPLKLGSLDSRRDWMDSRDCVRGMWMMLQQDKPDNYVLGSGVTRSIKDFLDTAFSCIGISNWSKLVVYDSNMHRPADVKLLCANPKKANEKLGWKTEIPFEQMVKEMVDNDTKLNNRLAMV